MKSIYNIVLAGLGILISYSGFGQCSLTLETSNLSAVCEVFPTITVKTSSEDYTYAVYDEDEIEIAFEEGNGGDITFTFETPLVASQTLRVETQEFGSQCATENVNITVNPFQDINLTPTAFTITSGDNISINLESTQNGVDYDLLDPSSNLVAFVVGTGGNEILVGENITVAGTYTIKAYLYSGTDEFCTAGIILSDQISVTFSTGGGINITTQPQDQNICQEENTSFFVGLDASPTSLQWQSSFDGDVWDDLSNDANYSGVNTQTLSITNTPIEFDFLRYRCVVDGNLESDAAFLSVSATPSVEVVASQGDYFCESAGAILSVRADSADSYQWFRDGNSIPGATQSIYTATQAGNYLCQVSSESGCIGQSSAVQVSSILNYSFSPTIASINQGDDVTVSLVNPTDGYIEFSLLDETENVVAGPVLNRDQGATLEIPYTNIQNSQTLNVQAEFFDQDLVFDGVDDEIKLPDNITQEMESFTFEIDLESTQGYFSRVFDFGINTDKYLFLTPYNGFNGNVISFAITTNGFGAEERIIASKGLDPGKNHLAFTLDAVTNTGVIYLNGVEIGRSTNITLNPSDLGLTPENFIGKSKYGSDANLNAQIDDVKIWNRALSLSEINDSRAGVFSTNDPDLILYYNFEGSLSTTVYDLANNNHGTLIGATQATLAKGDAICAEILNDELVINVGGEPEIAIHPSDAIVCPNSDAFFFVSASETPNSYTWQESTNNGDTWNTLSNNATYSGVNTSDLTVSSVDASFVDNLYRVILAFDNVTLSSDSAKIGLAQVPTASISAPDGLKGCAGNLPTLTANTDIGLYYQWFQAGVELDETNQNFTPSEPGSYTVSVSTDTCSTESQAVTILEITASDFPISPTNDVQPCGEGDPVSFTVEGDYLADISSIQWQRNGNNIPGATSVNQSFSEVGTYRAVIQAYNGCSFTTVSRDVLPSIINQVDLSPLTSSVPNGNSVSVQLSSSQSGIDYSLIRNQDQQVVDGPKAGTGTGITLNTGAVTENSIFVVRATDNNGCSITMDDQVVVNIQGSSTVIETQPEDQVACIDGAAVFSVLVSGPLEGYQWQVSETNGSSWSNLSNNERYSGVTTENLTISSADFSVSGNLYRVLVQASPSDITSASAELSVVANPIVNIFLPTGTSGCAENGVVIGTGEQTGYSYQWLLNGAEINGATEATFLATTSGFYQVEVTSDIGCIGRNDSIEISIVEDTDFNMSPNGTVFKCDENDAITLSINSAFSEDINSVTWFKDGVEISGVISPTASFSEAGVYTAIVNAYDGCSFEVPEAATLENRALSEIEFDKSISTRYCIGDNIEIPLLSSDAGVAYYLFNARNAQDVAGPVVGTGASISFNLTADPNIDFLGIRAVSASGNCFKVMNDDLFITISETPINQNLSLTGNDTLCGTINSTISSLEPATSSFQWYKDGAMIVGATSQSLELSEPGIYEVEIDNSFCVKRSNEQEIYFFNLEELLVNSAVSIGEDTLCERENFQLSLTQIPIGVEFYLFNINEQRVIGERKVSTQDNLDFSFLLDESARVSLVAEVGPCQELMEIINLTVIPSPTDNLPEISSEAYACSNEIHIPVANTFDSRSYQFFYLPNVPTSPVLNGTGDIETGKGGRLDFNFQVTPGDQIYLKILENEGEEQCAAYSDTITILDGGSTGKAFLNNFLIASEGCVNDTFRIFEQFDLSEVPDQIEWDFGDGSQSAALNPSKVYTSQGIYTVTVTATNNNCPSVSLEKTVEIENCPAAIGLPGNSGYVESIATFPNPSNGNFNFVLMLVEEMDMRVTLSNQFGKALDTQYFESQQYLSLYYNNLVGGMYFITVTTPHFKETKKVVIR